MQFGPAISKICTLTIDMTCHRLISKPGQPTVYVCSKVLATCQNEMKTLRYEMSDVPVYHAAIRLDRAFMRASTRW